MIAWLRARIAKLRAWVGRPLVWIRRRQAPPPVPPLPEGLATALELALAHREDQAAASFERVVSKLGRRLEPDGGQLIEVVVSVGRPPHDLD